MNDVKIDANDVINGLLETVGQQAKEIAMLKVQLLALTKEEDETDNGSDTV